MTRPLSSFFFLSTAVKLFQYRIHDWIIWLSLGRGFASFQFSTFLFVLILVGDHLLEWVQYSEVFSIRFLQINIPFELVIITMMISFQSDICYSNSPMTVKRSPKMDQIKNNNFDFPSFRLHNLVRTLLHSHLWITENTRAKSVPSPMIVRGPFVSAEFMVSQLRPLHRHIFE